MSKNHGFTLIELSIVLVIIGLIVGGVLVGQDLIASAQIRATIAQQEKFNTAVNTFRTKYKCIPGDCKNALQYGFAVAGDGDGIVDDYAGAETHDFWNQLGLANLIEGNFPASNGTLTNALGQDTPQLKMRTTVNAGWKTYHEFNQLYPNWDPINAFAISTEDGYGADGNTDAILFATEAQIIDQKIDDGAPTTGQVRAFGSSANPIYGASGITNYTNSIAAGGANSTECINSTPSPYRYNVAAVLPTCSLAIKTAF